MIYDLKLSTINSTASNFLYENPILCNINHVKLPPGTEHYLLLATISSQIKNGKIIELGTHAGISALALNYGNVKYNSNNKIFTYDIQYHLLPNIFMDNGINYIMENLFDPVVREQNKEHLLSSDVIFIDVDPHEGVMEYDMYLWLKNNNYKGLILFDDIHLGAGHLGVTSGNSMQQFWDKIDNEYKIDLTSIGHYSGTGLVCFDFDNHKIIYDN
jgi:predicted O-methyltransferase YrrM